MERMKTSRPSSKAAVALRVLAFLLLAAFAAVFARQVLLCRSALESIPMLLEYPELGETPPLTLEVFQRRVGEKAENSAAWQGALEVELPGGTQQMTARVALSNWGQVAGLALIEGDFYQPQAVLLRQCQAVVPEGVAAEGQTISIEGVDYTVCGVYQPEGETAPLYLSAHPGQPNSTLTPNRMLLAQNDRLRLSVLYDLQGKANYTPKAEGVDLGLWRQLLRQEVYAVVFCCAVLLCGCVLLRGYLDAVRLYGRWGSMLRGRKRALSCCLVRLILPVAVLNLVFCGVNLPAELFAKTGGENLLLAAQSLAANSDYLVETLQVAKQLAVLGAAAVLLFACGLLLWQLAGCKKAPSCTKANGQGKRPEQKSQSGDVRWRYHAPARSAGKRL